MKGTVKFFNVGKGLGKVTGEDGKVYFVHQSYVRREGLRFLVVGEGVTFTPAKDAQGRDQAQKVTAEKLPAGLEMRTAANGSLSIDEVGRAALRIDSIGRIYALKEEEGDPIAPNVAVEGAFRAYYCGNDHLRGVTLRLPESTAERGFCLLDQDKNPRRPRPDGMYDAQTGSYFVAVHADGRVIVWNLNRRIQGGREDGMPESAARHWLVVERRFECTYEFGDTPTAELLKKQTPLMGEASRDNDGFVPGILRALQAMRAAK